MMIVGLTGGIGSGKSTVAKMFKKLGVPVYDSDKRAKKLMVISKELREAIITAFGKDSYQNKNLNKSYLAEKVFNDEKQLKKLNSLVHPAVKKDFLNWSKKQKSPYVIQETALIYENQMQDKYDKVILVTAPQNERIERVVTRDKVAYEKVLARIKNQLNDEQKIPLADYVIDNKMMATTQKKVIEVHEELMKLVSMD
ncbi:MAG: dephospho-CoA kinase [Croceitalea sp.]|nr:dephospho-CoA kinase [Croceitalea sp.]MBT8239095.1 dephospho-CoA kinase [Croceitalea sp.]NNC35447.1 dephospho-CoA kinase [Croceitalea sp.]NNL09551.1 dephospho-CoA kinase [Croceitalea sp.]NNM17535.1 dephospho-CoA kinase [Croceitalea sp.]